MKIRKEKRPPETFTVWPLFFSTTKAVCAAAHDSPIISSSVADYGLLALLVGCVNFNTFAGMGLHGFHCGLYSVV